MCLCSCLCLRVCVCVRECVLAYVGGGGVGSVLWGGVCL